MLHSPLPIFDIIDMLSVLWCGQRREACFIVRKACLINPQRNQSLSPVNALNSRTRSSYKIIRPEPLKYIHRRNRQDYASTPACCLLTSFHSSLPSLGTNHLVTDILYILEYYYPFVLSRRACNPSNWLFGKRASIIIYNRISFSPVLLSGSWLLNRELDGWMDGWLDRRRRTIWQQKEVLTWVQCSAVCFMY